MSGGTFGVFLEEGKDEGEEEEGGVGKEEKDEGRKEREKEE